jgi:GNAT superfamily N-acetyltransferase
MKAPVIEQVFPPLSGADLRSLAQLLVEAVESGAAVSFLAPLTLDDAQDWWRGTISQAHSRAILLVARVDEEIVGTVQLQPAWAPNQPHRAEIAKLLVNPRNRRMGVATQLMRSIEELARSSGFRLLTLDAKRGEAAENLYRQMGWTTVGTILAYAFDPDGRTLHDAVVFCKHLNNAD